MPTTFEKRQRERSKQERQREKEQKRADRKREKLSRPAGPNNGEDPDIAGIIPGPQPIVED